MEPSHGCLEPESEKEVKLIFKADLESSYNVVLSINIPGVGKSILQAKSLKISSNFMKFQNFQNDSDLIIPSTNQNWPHLASFCDSK